jgi:hypothetical protein
VTGETRGALIAIAVLATACPHGGEGPQGPRAKTVRVRAFTEPSPVRLVASVGDYLFTAPSHGLDRWDRNGLALSLDLGHGAAGDRAVALAVDQGRGWLWVATVSTVGYYDVAHQTFAEVPPPPKLVGLDLPTVRALAASTDGGVWIGHGKGLFYVNPAGQWTATPITDPVNALYSADDGWLWLGTKNGVIGKKPTGESFRFGPDQGCEIANARVVVRGPGGAVTVIGEDKAGKQEVALGGAGGWSSFRVSPDVTWEAAAAHGDDVIVLGQGRLYRIANRGGERRPLTHDGYRLLATSGNAAAPIVDPLDVTLPAGAPTIAVWGDDVVVGSHDVGVARIAKGGAGAIAWLRRRAMFDGATALSIACKDRDDCWVATGARRAWRWKGDGFEPDGPVDQAVLAVVRAPSGDTYALHRSGDAKKITISKIEPDAWKELATLETPGDHPEVSFARFSPGGLLWVGLRYHQGKDKEEHPWGVALVDVALGAVAYHHASGDQREVRKGVLPVPTGVVDGAFMDEDEIWFATSEGVARLAGKKVTVWNEANGLESDYVRAIAASPGGIVFAATGAGVGEYDGDKWQFPKELAFPVNDLALAPDGRLWLATERGVALYDGKRVKRLDVRRGLIENEIEDVALDAFGRVWARGPGSITLISP